MYSLADYGAMVSDRTRVDAYAQALRATVREDSIVIDMGTGPGIFAVLACRCGAKRVYAIEPAHIIQVAREVAAANNCADRIEFIQETSTRAALPEGADVIVSDLHGALPFFQTGLVDLIDARRRFLAPGGVMIPRCDSLWAAIVEDSDTCKIVDVWKGNSSGLDLGPAHRLAANEPHPARIKSENLLTEPQPWATLDYLTIESPDASAQFLSNATRAGIGRGLVIWFDTVLAGDIGFSNGPGAPETVYGAMFFPWPEPVNLEFGQSVGVDLHAKLIGNNYFWCWNTQIHSLADPEEICTRFEQSQLLALSLSLPNLHKAGSRYIPRLSEEGRIHSRIFQLMDGQRSLESIARQLAGEFPQRFARWQDALSYAGQIAQEYSL